MAIIYDRVSFSTATTGAGTITVGSAVTKYQTPAQAGVPTGTEVSYFIEDGSNWEVGRGIYTVSGTTMTRILRRSSSGSLLSLTGSAIVTLTYSSDDIGVPHPGYASGRWFNPMPFEPLATGGGITSTFQVFLPVLIFKNVTITDLNCSVVTPQVGATLQLALYASDSDNRPVGAPVAFVNSLSGATAGAVSGAISGGNKTLTPGLYFVVAMGTSSVTLRTYSAVSSILAGFAGTVAAADVSSASALVYNIGGASMGSWLTITSASSLGPSASGNHGMVFLKAA